MDNVSWSCWPLLLSCLRDTIFSETHYCTFYFCYFILNPFLTNFVLHLLCSFVFPTAWMTSNNVTHFPSINLVSFNANGLGQDSKRKLVFDKLKSLDSIILLQETHCNKTLEKNGKRIGKEKSVSQMAQVTVEVLPLYFPQTLTINYVKNNVMI